MGQDEGVAAAEPSDIDDAPIFVSGIPRSGTTWMQWFLSQHRDIHIHGQLPKLDWQAGWQWYGHLIESGQWAQRANERIGYDVPHYAGSSEKRCRRLFADLVRGYLTGFAAQTSFWGVKSLKWCLDPGVVEQIESIWPQARWIVCFRDPFLSIASEKNTFRPDVDVNMAARGWVRMCQFAHRHDPQRTAIFQLDRHQDEEARLRAIARILRVIGVSHTPETIQAAKEFHVIHKAKPDNQRKFRFAEADKRRMLEEVEGLRQWMERLGYAVSDVSTTTIDCRMREQS